MNWINLIKSLKLHVIPLSFLSKTTKTQPFMHTYVHNVYICLFVHHYHNPIRSTKMNTTLIIGVVHALLQGIFPFPDLISEEFSLRDHLLVFPGVHLNYLTSPVGPSLSPHSPLRFKIIACSHSILSYAFQQRWAYAPYVWNFDQDLI